MTTTPALLMGNLQELTENVIKGSQRCFRCKEVKPLEDFHKSKNEKSGRAPQCKVCKQADDSTRYWKDPQKVCNRLAMRRQQFIGRFKKYEHKTRLTLRDKVLNNYGPVCVCCGETHRRFLTLDHIDGGGNKHYKAKKSNMGVYRDVLREGCPRDKYRILCYNCNLGRAHNGGICPHEEANRFQHD